MNSTNDAKAHYKTNNAENTIAGDAQTGQPGYPVRQAHLNNMHFTTPKIQS